MARRSQMCPNKSCSGHGVETRMMGGCGDCGTALVSYNPPYTPPTDEQLENFIHALMIGMSLRVGMSVDAAATATVLIMRDPAKREEWRAKHREMQEHSWGRAA